VLRRKIRKLEAVAMDMSAAFMPAFEVRLPHVPIVFDRYHVSALINKSIEELRRDQQSQLDEEGEKVLKDSRFLPQKNYKTLYQEKQTRLDQLLAANVPPLNIRTMKEKVRDFWEKDSLQESVAFLNAWCTGTENSCVKELKKIATTLMHHSHGLLHYHFYRLSCGIVEGVTTARSKHSGGEPMDFGRWPISNLGCTTSIIRGTH
jgi:transposase